MSNAVSAVVKDLITNKFSENADNSEKFCHVFKESINFIKVIKSWSLKESKTNFDVENNLTKTSSEEMRQRKSILDDGCKRNGSMLLVVTIEI